MIAQPIFRPTLTKINGSPALVAEGSSKWKVNPVNIRQIWSISRGNDTELNIQGCKVPLKEVASTFWSLCAGEGPK